MRRLASAPQTRTQENAMFDHVKFGVRDYAASLDFYLKTLEPLGVSVVDHGAHGVEMSTDGKSSLCLYQTEESPAHLHLAFMATTREQVDAFYSAALAAGGRDNGAPGLRPRYHANYYAAFVFDPDGHNIEAVCHEPEA
jgi:catechol 2,3-dioxygenase-like lactoylglutathione lyase family enzyme